jgi:regulator of sigma E protease
MVGFLQTALSYAVPFLLVLTLVVTIHEMGHFYAARLFRVAVDRFAIGFGRPLLKWRDAKGTDWQVGWIPLGGYVKFAGDENAASVPDKQDLEDMRREIIARHGPEAVRAFFHFKPLWQRAIIVAAGPLANFALAIVLFAVLLGTVGETTSKPVVTTMVAGSAAEAAGFKAGDVVLKADNRNINSFQDLERYVSVRGNVSIDFVVDRSGREVALTATPRVTETIDRIAGAQKVGRLGLSSQPTADQVVRKRYSPLEAIPAGAVRTWEVLDTTVYYLGRLMRGQVSAEQLGGPIRIAQASGAVAQAGAEGAPNLGFWILGSSVALLGLAAVLSVSIGFMNLLPIPVLDGGHLLFYAYEAITRKPLDARLQAAGYRVGLALLMGFMLFATWNDLQRLRVFKFLGGLFS